MKRGPDYYNEHFNFYPEIWKIIIFGTRETYFGVDPKAETILASVCKAFYNMSLCIETHNEFWKNHFIETFKNYKHNELFKLNQIWKNVFNKYCKKEKTLKVAKQEMVEIIAFYGTEKPLIYSEKEKILEKTSIYCLKLIKSKNQSVEKSEVFNLLRPSIKFISDLKTNPVALYCLGICYRAGFGVSKNDESAFKYLKLSADQGYLKAQYDLSILYEKGQGVEQSNEKAFEGYKLIADQGHAESQNVLAIFYSSGFGTEVNIEKSIAYYKLSADQGNYYAQYNLAMRYAKGVVLSQNYTQAFNYFKLSADQGDLDAQYQVGISYELGKGVDVNLFEAAKYYRCSASQGHQIAKQRLEFIT